MSNTKKSVHTVNNFSWVHPDDLKRYEKTIRKFVYTKRGKVRKGLLKDIEGLNTKAEPEEFIKCMVKKFHSAHRLNYYMKFRAFREFPGVPEEERYQHNAKFYYDGFGEGCFEFFGIKCCPCCGEIIEDIQNPDAYSRFLDNEKELKGPTVQ